jgi:hypothetical protein
MQGWPARRPSRLSGARDALECRQLVRVLRPDLALPTPSSACSERLEATRRSAAAITSAVLSRASRGRQDYSVKAEPRAERTAA